MTKDEALKMAMGVLLSINQGKQHLIVIDDDRGFFQREEWVRWAIDEVVPQIKDALEQPSVAELNDEYLRDTHVEGLQSEQEVKCNPHLDAPHGFMRDESHSQDRYVCECEYWTPPAQEPVYVVGKGWNCDEMPAEGTKLYTHPASSWQGLSDDDIKRNATKLGYLWTENSEISFKMDGFLELFARAIEQALKEKNNAM